MINTTNNVEEVNNNNIDELIRLFNEDYKKLYACAFRMVGNHEDAEEVLQNAFLKAYKNIHQFRGKSKLYTWVYRIVLNEGYRYFEYIDKLPVVNFLVVSITPKSILKT
ncbi:hypothetical protein HZI73_02965 [Vallitalea pronyensis]|uniref:RNA polymerase sigma-70 region 2 domain-containing protein n=1 Tax=Vallitalea pronyensis TaxID=1348613 RepID=A0A8J8MHF8_9FIRM|nr:sigma factor [Vallitalea pronyensis]QUI21308.1 hypothetical protein HZI73_02965 [Vallitalea pronyensis]